MLEQQTLRSTDNSTGNNLYKIIEKEEEKNGIPKGILNSIAAVESKHTPYAVNARKKSYNFETKKEASEFINTSVKNGCKNISVGCLQLHYKTHGSNFASIDDMLTPEKNVSYAANLLKKLYTKHRNWETAIKTYHTSKAKYNKIYYKKVMHQYNKKTLKTTLQ
jgi:soluble lytic murein transglycosylase-like protein